MPLARIILSMSQRCSSKRRTRGGPRWSRMGGKPCCGRFMLFLRWRAAGGGGQGRLRRYYRRGAYLVVNDACTGQVLETPRWCVAKNPERLGNFVVYPCRFCAKRNEQRTDRWHRRTSRANQ